MTKKQDEADAKAAALEYDAVGAIVRSGQSVLKVTVSTSDDAETVVSVYGWLDGSTEGFSDRLVHTSAEEVDAFANRVSAAIVAALGR